MYPEKDLVMKKLLVSIVLISIAFSAQPNATEAYFFSPHSLGRLPQLEDVITNTIPSISVPTTNYNHTDRVSYRLNNISVSCVFNGAGQTAQITGPDKILVSGGKIQFVYRFNWTSTSITAGYGFGSVVSDSVNYTKELFPGSKVPYWKLVSFFNVTITDRMKIKRLDPFTQNDLDALQIAMDQAISPSIDPSNLKQQILTKVNNMIPSALNDVLNHEVVGDTIIYNYTFAKGRADLILDRSTMGFDVLPEKGTMYRLLTKIRGWQDIECPVDAPTEAIYKNIYGGQQSVHMNCMYDAIFKYLLAKGWLDAELNSDWQTNAFQFFAGDLYDLVPNLYQRVNARSLLTGNCTAIGESSKFTPALEFNNKYLADIAYDCLIKSTQSGSPIDVLKWKAALRFSVQASALRDSLRFQIVSAEATALNFTTVNQFAINDIKLAFFKVNHVVNQFTGLNAFGTGFPALTKDSPRTQTQKDYVIYYDASHPWQINNSTTPDELSLIQTNEATEQILS